MRVIFFHENKKKPELSGKRIEIFPVRLDRRTMEWFPFQSGRRWGFFHPTKNKVVAFNGRPENYGRVVDFPDMNVETKVEMGTPELSSHPSDDRLVTIWDEEE